MKVWVPKQREVKEVVIITQEAADKSEGVLKAGDLQVTDADDRTRVYSPEEFAERFEEIEKASWPGYLKRKAGDQFMNGTLVVTFEADTIKGLGDAMNAWAADPLNRHLILGDNGDKYFQGTDGRFYAIYYCYAKEDPLATAHLDEQRALEQKLKAEWEEEKKRKGIDERNHLEKAKEMKAAADVIERTKRRELEKLAEVGKYCQHNHGKKMGKK